MSRTEKRAKMLCIGEANSLSQKERIKRLTLTLHFSQIQNYNLFLPKTLQLFQMNSSDQPYNSEETSESDYSSDTSQQWDQSLENNFLKEPKYLAFWSSLLLLFCYCFTCKEKTKISSARTRGTLLVVTMKCHNKHIHT